MNDLAFLKEQISTIKSDQSIARRLDWMRSGTFMDERKGATLLVDGLKPLPSTKPIFHQVQISRLLLCLLSKSRSKNDLALSALCLPPLYLSISPLSLSLSIADVCWLPARHAHVGVRSRYVWICV